MCITIFEEDLNTDYLAKAARSRGEVGSSCFIQHDGQNSGPETPTSPKVEAALNAGVDALDKRFNVPPGQTRESVEKLIDSLFSG